MHQYGFSIRSGAGVIEHVTAKGPNTFFITRCYDQNVRRRKRHRAVILLPYCRQHGVEMIDKRVPIDATRKLTAEEDIIV